MHNFKPDDIVYYFTLPDFYEATTVAPRVYRGVLDRITPADAENGVPLYELGHGLSITDVYKSKNDAEEALQEWIKSKRS